MAIEYRKLKFLTYLQLLLKLILVVLLFVDGMFVIETSQKIYNNGLLYLTREDNFSQSCLDIALANCEPVQDYIYENSMIYSDVQNRVSEIGPNNVICQIMISVVFAFLIFDILIDLLKLFTKKTDYKKWRTIIPIITLLIFVITSILQINNTSKISIYESVFDSRPYKEFIADIVLGVWFYVALVIFLATVVINLYMMVMSDKKLSEKASQFSFKLKKNESVPDQLEKYKELLENNIITEEEYEAKKKQLLDL